MIEYFQSPVFQPFTLVHDGHDPERVGVLLVHGFTGTPADMRPLALSLHALGADCHVMMHRGMANDIENLPTMTAAIWRKSVLDAWETMRGQYSRTILVGYSMGGAAAIQMAAEVAPDLLVLLAPFVKINDRRAMLLPFAKRVIPDIQFFSNVDFDRQTVRDWFQIAVPGLDIDDPEVRRKVKDESGIPPPVINELRKFGAAAWKEAGGVTCPVVILQGHDDRVVHPRDTRRLSDRFPQLQAYHEFRADHLVTLDTVWWWPRVEELVREEVRALLPS